MARIVSIPPTVTGGGLSGNLVAGLISNNVIDPFAVSDNNNITGQFLRDLIGSAFDPHRTLNTMNAVAASATAMNAVAASATAMNAVAASATATNAVVASATANNIALGSSFSIGAYLDRIRIIGGAATDATLAAQATMNAVVASATAMNAVAASATAMNAVAASATAMNAVAASATAMDAVAASATALNSIIKVASASVTITSAIQSRRATIISTMNAAPALFTRHVNQQLNVSAAAGNYDVANNTNTFIIPLSQHTAWSGSTYTLFSLANVAQIHQFVGNGGTVNISTGVALRGLRVHRGAHSGAPDITTYDMYTAV